MENFKLNTDKQPLQMGIKSNTFFFKITFCIFALALLNSCKNKSLEENAVAFSMSETMMQKCTFQEVKSEEVQNEIRLFGKMEADNNKTAQVFSIVSGLVTTINVGLGDYVKQGDVLATIRSVEMASYQKDKLNAVNNIAIAEKKLQVAKDLFAGKLNSEKDVTIAEKELEDAKTELARINEISNIYNTQEGSIFAVRAPISGFVITKNINGNELLRSDEDEPLFSIADTDEIWAVAHVNESDISKIRENYEVSIHTLAFPDTPYRGTIEKIYNLIDPTTKSMKFRVRLKNKDFQLKPDMNCMVNVYYSENRDLVTIPSSAIIFDKNKYWVLVFKNKKAIETRQIEIYRQIGDKTYILSGLDENETIISQNGLLVYDALND